MRVVDTAVPAAALRSRRLRLSHSETSLASGLEPGEVVLVGRGDDRWSARVAGITFELADTVYDLELGGRVPPEAAEDPSGDLAEVVALLGALRRAPVPPQRSAAGPALAAVAEAR